MIRVMLATTLAITAAIPVAADEVFMLRSGGRVEGDWLNRDETPRETFAVRTALGTIRLAADQVVKVVQRGPEDLAYLKLRPTVPDTVEGHEEMVAWCLENRLDERRRQHLERIIQLEPDHEAARIALGYRKVSGEWMTRDEEMGSRGMVMYAGRYRTRQEIEIWEREKKQNLAEREWYSKLKRWRSWLDNGKVADGVKNIRAIDDPFAVPAIVNALSEEKVRQARLLYLEVLAGIDSPGAVAALVETSLTDPDVEVRLSCLDHLERNRSPLAVKMFLAALHDKDNIKVNRAAIGLRTLGSEEVILPLIDALVTEHKFIVNNGPPGQMSTSFSPGRRGGGMSFGGKGPQVFKRDIPNEQVHSALVQLTDGKSFGYDQKAWKSWYTSQRKSPSFNSRRD